MELDEPIDYSRNSTHTGPQAQPHTTGSRVAKSVNDYFAGWEPSPEHLSAAEFEEFRQKELGTCDAVTQTPPEWLTSEAAQPPTEGERRRAEPRQGAIDAGTTAPNSEIRAACVS